MNGTRRLGVIVTVTVIAIVSAGTAAPAEPAGRILGVGNANAIPDNYIVVFEKNAITSASVLAAKHNVKVEHTYQHALQGFSGTMSRETAEKLSREPGVDYVEQNSSLQLLDTQPNPPSWGLDRISQRSLPLNSAYTYPNAAPNVHAYIIDTGIRVSHTQFGGRAVWGVNTTGDGVNGDCEGHGTHVAGTVGGSQFGVAKAVVLIAVKVFNCAGQSTAAGITAGVDWVTGNHQAGVPAVANMSLGGVGSNSTMENAVRRSIADGVVYTIASGNDNGIDACNVTPARVLEAITVNASTINDARASFSNIGPCTDVFAPGEGITSAWATGDTATNTISGTSMAAPHVAGAAALILSANPGLTPAQVANTLYANATANVIANPGAGSPNRLLFVAPGDPQQPDPTAVLYRSFNGFDHISWVAVPAGYNLEGPLGRVHLTQVAGTAPLFLCRLGAADFFTSRAANCEGQLGIGLIGFVYASQVPNTHPLYRCLVRGNNQIFDSIGATCEGHITVGPLGFLLN
jgi:subtilisin family serine protease